MGKFMIKALHSVNKKGLAFTTSRAFKIRSDMLSLAFSAALKSQNPAVISQPPPETFNWTIADR